MKKAMQTQIIIGGIMMLVILAIIIVFYVQQKAKTETGISGIIDQLIPSEQSYITTGKTGIKIVDDQLETCQKIILKQNNALEIITNAILNCLQKGKQDYQESRFCCNKFDSETDITKDELIKYVESNGYEYDNGDNLERFIEFDEKTAKSINKHVKNYIICYKQSTWGDRIYITQNPLVCK